jgi:hypothetical protein
MINVGRTAAFQMGVRISNAYPASELLRGDRSPWVNSEGSRGGQCRPSAINRHLLELEESVGAPLFDRLPRGVRLTAAGEILSLPILTTLRDYGRAISEIEQLKTGAVK